MGSLSRQSGSRLPDRGMVSGNGVSKKRVGAVGKENLLSLREQGAVHSSSTWEYSVKDCFRSLLYFKASYSFDIDNKNPMVPCLPSIVLQVMEIPLHVQSNIHIHLHNVTPISAVELPDKH